MKRYKCKCIRYTIYVYVYNTYDMLCLRLMLRTIHDRYGFASFIHYTWILFDSIYRPKASSVWVHQRACTSLFVFAYLENFVDIVESMTCL